MFDMFVCDIFIHQSHRWSCGSLHANQQPAIFEKYLNNVNLK